MKKMMQFGLVYKKISNKKLLILPLPYSLIKYANNNFTDNPKDQNLVMKNYFFLNKVVIL